MTDHYGAPPVVASEDIRFSCGCRLRVAHEFGTQDPRCFIIPCGPPLCHVRNALLDSKLTVSDPNGVCHRRPSIQGGL